MNEADPEAQEIDGSRAIARAQREDAAPATVLVADPSVGSRRSIIGMLRAASYHVLEAGSGEEALHAAVGGAPDLAIIDGNLPDMTGLEVCRQLKTRRETASISVLHLGIDGVTLRAPASPDGFLSQPVAEGELVATVRALLRTRRAEDRARVAAVDWEATFHAITEAVCLLARDGRVRRCNRAMEELLGRPAGTLRGRVLRELLLHELGAAGPATISDRREVTEIRVGERCLRMTVDPVFDTHGAASGSVYILSDITAQKRLEEELRTRAVELTAADRRKDEYLAMLGHELRNPLSGIRFSVHLLEEKVDEASRSTLATCLRQVDTLSRLVTDLVDVSRLTRGRIELRQEAVDLIEIVHAAARSASSVMEARGLDFAMSLPRHAVMVEVDAMRIDQVLGNLLDNAAKYTEPPGRVLLSVDVCDGRWVEIRVRDTGMGIAAELIPGIFDLFVQGQQPLDRARGGIGVGLTLVRKLVELHGGSVTAHSDGPGRGSEFVARLPLLAAVRPLRVDAGGSARIAAPDGVVVRVLLIDDNDDARDTLREILTLSGHDVDAASDGVEGVAMAMSRLPDVALVDIGLPGIDGYEVARRIRVSPGGRDVFLVAVTGYGQPSDRRRALEAGFDLHLVKPVDPRDLRSLMRRIRRTAH